MGFTARNIKFFSKNIKGCITHNIKIFKNGYGLYNLQCVLENFLYCGLYNP